MNTKHKQVSVFNPTTKEILDVDEKLQHLLVRMWGLGISTNYSCQGDTHLFVNEDCWEARQYRAYIQMKRDIWSLGFVQEMLKEKFMAAEHVSFDIEFSQNPKTKEERITVRFPSCYIIMLDTMLDGWN